MKRTWKRLSALVLALVMVLSLLPTAALATKIDGDELPAEPAADAAAWDTPAADRTSASFAAAEDDAIEATDASRDIDRTTYTVSVSNQNADSHASEGPKEYAVDGNTGRFWHSNTKAAGAEHWIAVELSEAKWVSALRYLPRTDTIGNAKGAAGNGFVTEYRIETSLDGDTWTTPTGGTGTWAPFNSENKCTGAWQVANFTPVRAKFVKLVGVHTECNSGQPTDAYMHANEIRIVAALDQPTATYSVSGTVSDDNGVRLPNAVVTIGGQTTTTNTSGEFTIGDLIEGSYTISVTLEGYGIMSGGSVAIAGGNVTGHAVRMQRVDRRVTGTVTGLSGASVTLVQAAAPYSYVSGVTAVETGTDGGYSLNVNNVPAGSYRVRASKAGYDAALSQPVEIITTSAVGVFPAGATALTAVDTAAAWYNFDLSDAAHTPQWTVGSSSVAVRVANGGLFMNFGGNSRANNTVKLSGVKFGSAVVEFDAARGGTNTSNGFGVLLGEVFVGLNEGGSWLAGSAAAVAGPSFASGETRHFKLSLAQSKVTLAIDGVTVLNQVSVTQSGDLCELAFTSDKPQTEVTVKNLYVTRTDTPVILTVPADLTGYTLISSALDMPLKAAAGTENGFTAYAGDVINVYSADPAQKEMTAPLKVYKTADNSLVSTENILHITTTTSAHLERGYYVQLVMPAYNATLEAAMKAAVTAVAIEKDDATGVLTAAVTPEGATADFRWYREGSTADTWNAVGEGASYTPTAADVGKRLKVEAIGTGTYGGKVSAIETVTSGVNAVTILRAGDPTLPEMIDGVNGTVTLKAVITPGVAADVTWASGDESIATVEGQTRAVPDENGATATATAVVTGVAGGTVTITVTSDGKSDTRQVEVGVGVDNVIFTDPSAVTLYTNGKTAGQPSAITLTPTVRPDNATHKDISWSSSDGAVATVDAGGLVTAVAPGTARITAISKQNPEASAYRDVTVVTLPTALTLDVTTAELILGEGDAANEVVVTPTLTPAATSDRQVSWSSSDPSVASVARPESWVQAGSQAAIVTAEGVGTATITAVSQADNTVTATLAVTVRQRITGRITISGDLYVGRQLEANINNIVQGAKDGLTYQWYRGGQAAETAKIAGATGKTYTPVAADLGSVLTVVVTADGTRYVGSQTATTSAAISKAPNPDTPNDLRGVAPTSASATDGRITGLDLSKLYEYQSASAGENDPWTKVAANSAEITGLAPGNYRVRFQETAAQQASAARNATVPAYGVTVYQVAVAAMSNGNVTREPAQAAQGTAVRLTVAPAEGYQLKAGTLLVTGADDTSVTVTPVTGSETGFTFTMPAQNVTVSAQFEKKTYTITHALQNISCDMVSHDHTAVHGEVFTITLTPDPGHEMPKALTLTVTGTDPVEEFHDYTYTVSQTAPEKRVLTFAHGVTANITVSGEATKMSYPVSSVLERVRLLNAPSRVEWHGTLSAALVPETGYVLPAAITITSGGVSLTPETDFAYSPSSGLVQIRENVIEGAVEITARGERIVTPLEKVSISGVAQVGQRLTANLTPADADGYVTYQWYWVDSEGNEELIPGATGRSRVVTEQSLNKSILVKAEALTGRDFSGSVASQPTGTVIAAQAAGVMPQWVQIRRESVTLEQGGTDTLVAYVGPDNATNKTVLWSSSNERVVTVDNGVITAVGVGAATVTVRTQADETVTDVCAITVNPSRTILVQAEDVTVPYNGMAYGISVTVLNPTGGSAAVTYSVDGFHYSASIPTFSAVGEHIVWYQVTSAGMTTLQSQGKVTIQKVTPEITLTADQSTLPQGGTVTLTVTVPAYVDSNGMFLTADDLMIPVEKTGEGVYTAQLPSTPKTYSFIVTLTGTNNYNGASASYQVTVGSSGGSSSGGSTTTTVRPVTNTVTKKAEDGSVITTSTDVATGTVKETVVRTDGTRSETVTTKDGAVTITASDKNGKELAKVKLPASIPTPAAGFVDLDAVPWAEEAINHAAGLELVKGIGDSRYDPIAPMTRGSLATVLHRLSQGKADYAVTFKDVAQGKYYTEGVAWAAKVNVVKGISADVFAPDNIITREQLAVMLYRYARLLGMDTAAGADRLWPFADGEKTGAWAVDGVAWCVEHGILMGKGGNVLDPAAEVTRAEVAVMLDRFIALLK